jgi:pimeloyl-ACP methyl ester carboxylesterase
MVQTNKLNYRVTGNGRPVVFLHGFLESISMWKYLGDFEGVQSIVVDLPGHGESPLIPELTMQSIANLIIQLLDELKVVSYDIVGHSMGGYVALEVKKNHNSCDKIILLNSNFWQDTALKKEDRYRVAALVKERKEVFLNSAIPNLFLEPHRFQGDVDALIDEAKSISWESIAEASIAMSERTDNRILVKEHCQDVVIIQGVHDTTIPQKVMLQKLSGIEVLPHMVPSGHMAHIECGALIRHLIEGCVGV